MAIRRGAIKCKQRDNRHSVERKRVGGVNRAPAAVLKIHEGGVEFFILLCFLCLMFLLISAEPSSLTSVLLHKGENNETQTWKGAPNKYEFSNFIKIQNNIKKSKANSLQKMDCFQGQAGTRLLACYRVFMMYLT